MIGITKRLMLVCVMINGKLYAFSDGGQGLILFYGDETRIEQLKRVIPQPP